MVIVPGADPDPAPGPMGCPLDWVDRTKHRLQGKGRAKVVVLAFALAAGL